MPKATPAPTIGTELMETVHAQVEALQGVEMVPLAQVFEALITGRRPDPVDSEILAKIIGLRLLMIDDIDEIMDPEGRNTGDKLLDEPLWLRSVMFLPSDIDDASVPVYAVMDLSTPDGELKVFSCGARGVVNQCAQLMAHGKLPRLVKLIEVGSQKVGKNRPLYLQDVKRSGD